VNGAELYSLVEEYHGFGVHRAGTEVDHAVAAWMADQLAARGLTVETQEVPFSQWVAKSRLTIDGEEVDHLPVYHEWTGSISTTPATAVFDPKSGGMADVLNEPVSHARAAGADAVVLATQHPNGSLVGVNRHIGGGSGFPTVLVAGRDSERLLNGSVHLEMEAEERAGHTVNLVAHNQRDAGTAPLLLTTPLTGWFGCAGERGTGIAVLIELVERFVNDRPLLVVPTGGHELHYFGADHWVDTNPVDPNSIVHVGASVAVEETTADGIRQLASTRMAMTSLSNTEAAPLGAALEPARLALAADVQRWIGEGEIFCRLNTPMLSFTGAGVDFHTPEDTPQRATSPAALATVAEAFAEAAALIDTR
jgi:hypothetical protein